MFVLLFTRCRCFEVYLFRVFVLQIPFSFNVLVLYHTIFYFNFSMLYIDTYICLLYFYIPGRTFCGLSLITNWDFPYLLPLTLILTLYMPQSWFILTEKKEFLSKLSLSRFLILNYFDPHMSSRIITRQKTYEYY